MTPDRYTDGYLSGFAAGCIVSLIGALAFVGGMALIY